MDKVFHGSCYCGKTQVEVTGAPLMALYCHCRSCRKWHSAPLAAGAAWLSGKVQITGDLVTSSHEPESQRVSCASCGGCVANRKPGPGRVFVYLMTLAGSGLAVEPDFHIFYAERVMDVNDGLPKYADGPEAFGYSGEMVGEPAKSAWRD